jgi:spermidine/putrescine transport system substrate-binding protein
MSQHEPSTPRGLSQRRLSRRDVIRLGGLSATALGLAACGVKGKEKATPAAPAPDEVATFWAGKTSNGRLSFANWPLYMDPKKPELKAFTQKTGIQVKYDEVIEDSAAWFAKIQPQLAANQSIGYDLMEADYGIYFSELVELGYLAPLDHSKLPNFAAHVAAKYKSIAYDPGNKYSVPWASGFTGIAYDPDKVATPPARIADLFDPRYKGKVGMFSDTQELGNFGMLVLGVDPEKSTPDDWRRAAAKLKEQRDAGIVRKYYDQSYIDDLGKGNIWLTMAWSGDIFQKNLSDGTNLKFVIPEEGGSIWTGNLVIPKTAENPLDALMLMDHFFDPKMAASLATYINYITPVPEARDIILADAAAVTGDDKKFLTDLASSPLVFPTDADYDRVHYYRSFANAAERTEYQSVFEPLVTA